MNYLIKIFSLLFCFVSTIIYAEETTRTIEASFERSASLIDIAHLPDEFTVTERWFSWTSTFDIESKTQKLGYVKRRFFSLTTQYDFYDVYDQLLSTSKSQMFSFGYVFDVKDASNIPLGAIEEKIFTFFPSFRIFSPDARILATAKLNFWGTTFYLYSPFNDKDPIATISRPFFSFRDYWTVNILNRAYFESSGFHPLLFITIATLQTDLDNLKSRQAAAEVAIQINNQNNNSGDSLFSTRSTSEEVTLPRDSYSYKKEIRALKNMLSRLKSDLPQVEPSQEDFEIVANLVDEMLTKKSVSSLRSALKQLFDKDTLPPVQKSALYLLLNKKIDQEIKSLSGGK